RCQEKPRPERRSTRSLAASFASSSAQKLYSCIDSCPSRRGRRHEPGRVFGLARSGFLKMNPSHPCPSGWRAFLGREGRNDDPPSPRGGGMEGGGIVVRRPGVVLRFAPLDADDLRPRVVAEDLDLVGRQRLLARIGVDIDRAEAYGFLLGHV